MILSYEEALNRPDGVTAIKVPAVRYEFVFGVTTPIRSPEYAGSMIRGAFGRALRKTACMTRQSDCKSCPLYRTCPYTAIFEAPPPMEGGIQKFSHIPNPYVIEPPEWGKHEYEVGEHFRFSLVLWGRARAQLALIIYAMQRAFSYDVGHGKAKLLSVAKSNGSEHSEIIFTPAMERVTRHEQESSLAVPFDDMVTMTLETPMRLQNNGRPLGPDLITSRALLMTLTRRASLLSAYQCGIPCSLNFNRLIEEGEKVELKKHLDWRDWTRYSSRQQRQMSFGGVVGSIELCHLSPTWRIMLTLGLLTHVGKNSSFGLGRYRLEGKE